MWMVKNTGKNRSESFFGYYCVMNCTAKGTVTLNGKTYNVSGLGYHDHTWAPMRIKKPQINNKKDRNLPKKAKSVDFYRYWDWFVIHFDNGWDMFIGKIYFGRRNSSSRLIPGVLCFTPDGKKINECYFFVINHKVTTDTSVPGLKKPLKIHIKALILNPSGIRQFKGPVILDFYYEAQNTQETVAGDPLYFAIFQSQGKIYGTAKSLGKTIKLNGWAFIETATKV